MAFSQARESDADHQHTLTPIAEAIRTIKILPVRFLSVVAASLREPVAARNVSFRAAAWFHLPTPG
jgi:hypothetical protein